MDCPTCKRTPQMIFNAFRHAAWWCDRCGTLSENRMGVTSHAVPTLAAVLDPNIAPLPLPPVTDQDEGD